METQQMLLCSERGHVSHPLSFQMLMTISTCSPSHSVIHLLSSTCLSAAVSLCAHLTLLEPVLTERRPYFHLVFYHLFPAFRSVVSLLAPPRSQPEVVTLQVLFNLDLWAFSCLLSSCPLPLFIVGAVVSLGCFYCRFFI